jgi:hypothetical protein
MTGRHRTSDAHGTRGVDVGEAAASRDAIEAELLDWMRESPWRRDEARFERLALALFRFQLEACDPYRRFCLSLDRSAEKVSRVDEIPAVPTGAFKEFDLRCFPARDEVKTFRTSGTSTARRGRLHLDTLRLYEASLLSSLRETFLVELRGTRPTMRFLAPSAESAPDSSLSHMFETLRREEGGAASGFDLVDGTLDLGSLEGAVRHAERRGEPLLLLGTAFAFVHWLDAAGATPGERPPARFRLPAGSRVLETGGFKGRGREVAREVLRADLATFLGLPERAILNQYGMTELGSQFYDSSQVDPDGPRRKLAPPWTRIRIVDPATGLDAKPSDVGLVVVHDLANTGSVAAIETADLGRAVCDAGGEPIGFDVLGRLEGAEERGCSIATDAMLEAARAEARREEGPP